MIFLFVFCCLINIKGIVHPKMKILSSFTHSHVVVYYFKVIFYGIFMSGIGKGPRDRNRTQVAASTVGTLTH